ncbi:hypothetical protein AB0K00_40765 [Dactylosporangium sp. NPDC049525]|uniref:hypothetical protein n=1 Tax=Dactylosporangium sp. NPDC049525 TaxID=3154730 RepID=UPI0034399E50
MNCYLLEFSVGPGGARQGDVHAARDVGTLRAAFERRYDEDAVAYLTLWYGAVLHLWVVRDGVLAGGFDLHPFLRTGDERHDATVTAILGADRDGEPWELFDRVSEATGFESLDAVRVVTQVLDLRARAGTDPAAAARLADLEEAVDAEDLPAIPGPPCAFTLDWAAIAAAVPPLHAPVLQPGVPFVLTWPDDAAPPADSYLWHADALRLGLNDIEGGYDEFEEA